MESTITYLYIRVLSGGLISFWPAAKNFCSIHLSDVALNFAVSNWS